MKSPCARELVGVLFVASEPEETPLRELTRTDQTHTCLGAEITDGNSKDELTMTSKECLLSSYMV